MSSSPGITTCRNGGEGEALSAELRQITGQLRNTNLQRADRMTMAHGLEGRVPFLDRQVVEVAFRIHPALKWRRGDGKWVLRRMAERYLPSSIAWREKEKFAIGTGIGPLLERHARERIGPAAGRHPEEQLYWSLFRDRYGRPDVLREMGHSRSLNPTERWVASVQASAE